MENKGIDMKKIAELGLDQLDSVSGGSGYFEGPLARTEERECKNIIQRFKESGVNLSLDEAILHCSYLIRRKTYDEDVAEYVRRLF